MGRICLTIRRVATATLHQWFKVAAMTTNYLNIARESLEDADHTIAAIAAEHQGLNRPHVVADRHLEHRHALKTAEVSALIAIAQKELKRIGLAQ